MIPKASQRGGGQQLATHLLNRYDNDLVVPYEVRGAIAQDLHGAFAEWRAMAKDTKCRKYLYSMSVNPDDSQGPLTREQYLDYLDRAERKLGMQNQPRAVVFHIKHGREHCHAVWSRIDPDTLKAVNIFRDWRTLKGVTIEFARDHGLELPAGYKKRPDREQKKQRENLGEKQQEERTGIPKKERMAAITAAWRETQTAEQFIQALEQRGYLLARGDKRAYVIVDRFGEIHSLPRQIEGVNTKQVKERLKSLPLDRLPDARDAQDFARDHRKPPPPDLEKAAELRRRALELSHRERRAAIDLKRRELEQQHHEEHQALADAQKAEIRGVEDARLQKRPQGLLDFVQRITGIRALIGAVQKRQDRQREERHRDQREKLSRRHGRELADFERHYHALHSIETREKQSLETALKREAMRAVAPEPVREIDAGLKQAAKRRDKDQDGGPGRDRDI